MALSMRSCLIIVTFLTVIAPKSNLAQEKINLWWKQYEIIDSVQSLEEMIGHLGDELLISEDSSHFDFSSYMANLLQKAESFKNEEILDSNSYILNDYIKVDTNLFIHAYNLYTKYEYQTLPNDSVLKLASLKIEDTLITAVFPQLNLDTTMCYYNFSNGKLLQFKEVLKTKGNYYAQNTINYHYLESKNTAFIYTTGSDVNKLLVLKYSESIKANKVFLFIAISETIELQDLNLLSRILLFYPELLDGI